MSIKEQLKEWRKLNPIKTTGRVSTLQSIKDYREELKYPVRKVHETTIPTTKELYK